MSTAPEYYMDQAHNARAEADVAVLDNVRERCLRSEAAWLEMAARAGRHERLRAKAAADKADRLVEMNEGEPQPSET